jgi:hypothetical protein
MKACFFLITTLLIAFTCTGALATEELTDAKVQQLITELRPTDDEVWRTIPWKTDLLDGQRHAADDNIPIFIWSMDGHPLGCT